MISAVLDTNVLVSGALTSSSIPGQILNAWRENEFELIISEYIIYELERVFQKAYFQKHLTSHEIKSFFDLLQNEAIYTPIIINVNGVATHPEDDLMLAAAVSAKADYFVTGDQPLLQKVGNLYKKVNLVTPKEFLQILEQQN